MFVRMAGLGRSWQPDTRPSVRAQTVDDGIRKTILRLLDQPKLVSVLDYSKGFGHTQLVSA